MSMDARIESLTGPLPSIAWRWDPETDILSGAFKDNRKGGGLTGSIELADAEGSIAVLDVNCGVVCGIDIVIWPEVATVADLRAPDQPVMGRVVLPSRPSRPGIASVEVDTTLSVQTNPSESVFHLQIGPTRPVKVIQVANRFCAEVDHDGELAGFWLTEVPPFTSFEEV
jgi:hypothetical protein